MAKSKSMTLGKVDELLDQLTLDQLRALDWYVENHGLFALSLCSSSMALGYKGHHPPTLEAEYAHMKDDIGVLIKTAWRLEKQYIEGFMTENVFHETKDRTKHNYYRPDKKLISMYRVKMVEVLKFGGFRYVYSKQYKRKFWKSPIRNNKYVRDAYIGLLRGTT